MTHHRFLEPVDVLFLRGNRHFGDPGSYGESHVPPPPSVAAGALRSWLLVEGRLTQAQLLDPQAFTLTDVCLARHRPDGQAETFHGLPADLAVLENDRGEPRILWIAPRPPAAGLSSSASLPQWPLLPLATRSKLAGGYLLRAEGWARYLRGETLGAHHLVKSRELWSLEARVGVGLDPERRRASDGQLFTAQAVAFRRTEEGATGFLVGIRGTEPPRTGTVRFGGDGRGALVHTPRFEPAEPDHSLLSQRRRARLVLTTPGIFPQGWHLPGLAPDRTWQQGDVRARLVAASVPRAQVVSGWDLAAQQPKPAERAAPAGSVYWFEDLEATAEALRKLAERGLWDAAGENTPRRAEGFNRFVWASH